jgi:hypothetical protein
VLPPLLLWPSSDGTGLANIALGGMAMTGRAGLGAGGGDGDGKPAVLDVVSPLAAAVAAALPPLSGRCVCGSMPRLRSLRLMCVFQ